MEVNGRDKWKEKSRKKIEKKMKIEKKWMEELLRINEKKWIDVKEWGKRIEIKGKDWEKKDNVRIEMIKGGRELMKERYIERIEILRKNDCNERDEVLDRNLYYVRNVKNKDLEKDFEEE